MFIDCIYIRGARESHKECIPLGVDLAAVPFGEGTPHDKSLVSQQGCVLIAQSIQQLCRTFDVSEQEGYRTFGDLSLVIHPISSYTLLTLPSSRSLLVNPLSLSLQRFNAAR